MTTIERIGQFTITQHGPAVVVIDRKDRQHQVFHTERDARDYALSQVDLVDLFATVH